MKNALTKAHSNLKNPEHRNLSIKMIKNLIQIVIWLNIVTSRLRFTRVDSNSSGVMFIFLQLELYDSVVLISSWLLYGWMQFGASKNIILKIKESENNAKKELTPFARKVVRGAFNNAFKTVKA